MSPDFLDDYAFAVETAAALGLKLCLYDEFWFPSGSAGNLMAKNYPEALNKCLEKVEVEITGPTTFEDTVSDGRLMGVVAMKAGYTGPYRRVHGRLCSSYAKTWARRGWWIIWTRKRCKNL